jgi:DNA invertase Pin-like site-specific DNA recombinase
MTKRGREPAPDRVIRCAVYTRKSSEEGLDQDFNSLDAQREAAESFIASQRAEGWRCLPARYDDGGFTGGNMDRPAVQRLIADIEAGLVDCVVVYKVDRLSRSLIDFARMMEVFEKRGVSFVSVTQQFNTTHSMGRLTLHILLSFAQFEREIISERTRDKIAAAKRKGMWGGGRPILGYDIARLPGGNRLVVNAAEADGAPRDPRRIGYGQVWPHAARSAPRSAPLTMPSEFRSAAPAKFSHGPQLASRTPRSAPSTAWSPVRSSGQDAQPTTTTWLSSMYKPMERVTMKGTHCDAPAQSCPGRRRTHASSTRGAV